MKNKTKYYLVVYQAETDGEVIIKSMTNKEILELVDWYGYQEEIAIIEGNLIKGFDNKIDLTKL